MPWRRVGKWKYSSTILKPGTTYRRVLNFTSWPLYRQGKRTCYLLNTKLGDPGATLDAVEKRRMYSAKKRTSVIQLVPRHYTDWDKEGSRHDMSPLNLFLIECMVMVFISYFFLRTVHLHFVTKYDGQWKISLNPPADGKWEIRYRTNCCGVALSMSARRCNRSAQVSVCSVVAVPFESDVSVSRSAEYRSSNSVWTSSSCPKRENWENLFQRRYRFCIKFTVILHTRNTQCTTGVPGVRKDRRRWRMTSRAGRLGQPE